MAQSGENDVKCAAHDEVGRPFRLRAVTGQDICSLPDDMALPLVPSRLLSPLGEKQNSLCHVVLRRRYSDGTKARKSWGTNHASQTSQGSIETSFVQTIVWLRLVVNVVSLPFQ